ncbi:hypothetical protein BC938DRAFT_471936, partial [Jimgerdemannia flammicorona]
IKACFGETDIQSNRQVCAALTAGHWQLTAVIATLTKHLAEDRAKHRDTIQELEADIEARNTGIKVMEAEIKAKKELGDVFQLAA